MLGTNWASFVCCKAITSFTSYMGQKWAHGSKMPLSGNIWFRIVWAGWVKFSLNASKSPLRALYHTFDVTRHMYILGGLCVIWVHLD